MKVTRGTSRCVPNSSLMLNPPEALPIHRYSPFPPDVCLFLAGVPPLSSHLICSHPIRLCSCFPARMLSLPSIVLNPSLQSIFSYPLVSLLVLEHIRYGPASGPLCLLFLLNESSSLPYRVRGFTEMSVKLSLVILFRISHPLLNAFSFFIFLHKNYFCLIHHNKHLLKH